MKQRSLSAVHSDHDYSCPSKFITTFDSSEKEQLSPTTLSDSGVSSDSRFVILSPTSFTCNFNLLCVTLCLLNIQYFEL